MRPPVPRFVRWAVALAVIAALTVAVFQYWGTSQYGAARTTGSAQSAQDGWMQTRWGPLGPTDRDLLVMVRLAGMSGGASGQQAQQQGGSAQVRTVARHIWADYGNLDSQVRSIAGKLGVPLPDQPTAQQQGWMRDLSGRSGPNFDRMFAQRLRLTDGAVLPVITSVRAGTRNELIRSFATNAAALVNQHMEELEHTGLVDYSGLPTPLPPAAAPPAPSAAGAAPAGREQRIDQVVNATQVPPTSPITGNSVNAMVAAMVSIAALLVALGLLGSTGRRVRRAGGTPPHRRRHAAHRW